VSDEPGDRRAPAAALEVQDKGAETDSHGGTPPFTQHTPLSARRQERRRAPPASWRAIECPADEGSMAKKIGVVLSGCGVIRRGGDPRIPSSPPSPSTGGRRGRPVRADSPQCHGVDHLSGQVDGEPPATSCRVRAHARGHIGDVASVTADELRRRHPARRLRRGEKNPVRLPRSKGADCSVHPEVARLVARSTRRGRPVDRRVGIAPALVAKVLRERRSRSSHPGADRGDRPRSRGHGATHVPCAVRELAVDREKKLVSTPAYMLGKRISEVRRHRRGGGRTCSRWP